MWILALKMAYTSKGPKHQIEVVGDICSLDFGPDMVTIALIHAVHGFGLRMRCQGCNKGEDKVGGEKEIYLHIIQIIVNLSNSLMMFLLLGIDASLHRH